MFGATFSYEEILFIRVVFPSYACQISQQDIIIAVNYQDNQYDLKSDPGNPVKYTDQFNLINTHKCLKEFSI